jgi:ketosteroid isomerase-like protein
MRRGFIALALAAMLYIPAAGQESVVIMTTVQHFVDAFNKGDAKATIAMCAEQTDIIDEFAPYEWHGAGACAKWFADYDQWAKKNTITDGSVTLGSPRHVDVVGERVYVVVPADFTFKQNGTSDKETGSSVTMVLRKGAHGWRISAWTWSKG